MSRDALPPVPNVEGTPAQYDATTFARVWPERRQTWTAPTHPEPVQRAIEVSVDATCVPTNARKIAAAGIRNGWPVRITHAIGYGFDNKTGGLKTKSIMAPIGDGSMTTGKKPRLRTHKIGETPADPVDSLRVVVKSPDRLLMGHWVDGGWDSGLALAGHLVVRNCNWGELWEAFTDAESRAHLRGETPDGQLSLEGHDGKPL